MTRPRIGGLFEGYGGLSESVKAVLGGDLIWYSEIEPAACKVLEHHYPDAVNLGDITQVDWSQVPPVDILTGGFPCQDVSSAGRRAGLNPDTRSGLWVHMAKAIAALRPGLVFIENVRGLLSADADSALEPCPWCVGDGPGSGLRALGAVLGDLADLGFDAEWRLHRASDVGAPHQRGRIFILAADTQCGELQRRRVGGVVEGTHGDGGPTTPDAAGFRRGEGWPETGVRRSSSVGGDSPQPEWAEFESAIRRWERRIRRAAPTPAVPLLGRKGRHLAPAFVEWMMGLPAGHVTDVPDLSRSQQLKLLGNGVIPAQGAAALRHLLPLLLEAQAGEAA